MKDYSQSQLCTAHDWMDKLPLNKSMLVCVRCGIDPKVGEWDVSRCTPHYVFVSSGWKIEK